MKLTSHIAPLTNQIRTEFTLSLVLSLSKGLPATKMQPVLSVVEGNHKHSKTNNQPQTMNCEQSTTKDYVRNYKLFMQNEPNLCVFWAVSGDCEEKRTQNEPNLLNAQNERK
jgi:hypothetical protein